MNSFEVFNKPIDMSKVKEYIPNIEEIFNDLLKNNKRTKITKSVILSVITDIRYINLLFKRGIYNIDYNLLKMVKSNEIGLNVFEAEQIVMAIQNYIKNTNEFKQLMKDNGVDVVLNPLLFIDISTPLDYCSNIILDNESLSLVVKSAFTKNNELILNIKAVIEIIKIVFRITLKTPKNLFTSFLPPSKDDKAEIKNILQSIRHDIDNICNICYNEQEYFKVCSECLFRCCSKCYKKLDSKCAICNRR